MNWNSSLCSQGTRHTQREITHCRTHAGVARNLRALQLAVVVHVVRAEYTLHALFERALLDVAPPRHAKHIIGHARKRTRWNNARRVTHSWNETWPSPSTSNTLNSARIRAESVTPSELQHNTHVNACT